MSLSNVLMSQIQRNPHVFWMVFGAGLALIELFIPTAFTLFVMGLSAILVGFFAILFPKFLHLQMIIWLVLSIGTIYLSHRFMPKGQNRSISDATEGKTITEILPGEFGRVMFEGNSWRARCSDDKMTIPANTKVYVVAREGTTLTVMAQNLLTEN